MLVTAASKLADVSDQRERLLDATIELLQERGYARTTTRAIVERAGSHLPAVNYYYGSKDALLQEAIVEALRRWCETTIAAAEEPAGVAPAERLRLGLQRFLAALEADRPYVVAALEAFAQAERSEELRARLASAYADFRTIIARGIERDAAAGAVGAPAAEPGEEPTEPAAPRRGSLALASVVIALFDGFAIQWLLDPEATADADEVLATLATLVAILAPATGDQPAQVDAISSTSGK